MSLTRYDENHQAWNAAGRRVAQWAAACTLGAGA
jgi:hypothetical protein